MKFANTEHLFYYNTFVKWLMDFIVIRISSKRRISNQKSRFLHLISTVPGLQISGWVKDSAMFRHLLAIVPVGSFG